ncbi:hypothetical protein G9A89_015881 [Geosiphon pyriformis]|nr:hypothetical protein G9A89_015881 [Geosiphon pyriformis]
MSSFLSSNTIRTIASLVTIAISVTYFLPSSKQQKPKRRKRIPKHTVKKITAGKEAGTYFHGLVNGGNNTCFMNSVLQALAALPLLRKYLLKRIRSGEVDENTVTVALNHLLSKLNEPIVRPNSFLPREIVWALQANAGQLINREQQDAHELFALLSSALSEEEEVSKRPKSLFSLSVVKNSTMRRKLLPLIASPVENNPLRGLTACRISCMRCGHSGPVRHTTFDHISVPLPQISNYSLEQVLRSYTSLEFIDDFNCRNCGLLDTLQVVEERLNELRYDQSGSDNMTKRRDQLESEKRIIKIALTNEMEIEDEILAVPYKKVKTAAIKQTMFARLPSIFAIHFSRTIYVPNAFGGMMIKNPCEVRFPLIVNLASYLSTGYLANMPSELALSSSCSPPFSPALVTVGVAERQLKQEEEKYSLETIGETGRPELNEDDRYYRLNAVIVHVGDHSRGHFITYRRQIKDNGAIVWWRTSDEHMREVSLETVLKEEAYMLFYEKLETLEL